MPASDLTARNESTRGHHSGCRGFSERLPAWRAGRKASKPGPEMAGLDARPPAWRAGQKASKPGPWMAGLA
jgi:hypothetical protein